MSEERRIYDLVNDISTEIGVSRWSRWRYRLMWQLGRPYRWLRWKLSGLPHPAESFRQAWSELMRGETHPIETLWEDED